MSAPISFSHLSGRSQTLGEHYLWVMVLLQRERDLNTAARIGQSLVKQNSVLMEENSKLEALLGSAKEEVTGWGGEDRGPVYTHLMPGPSPAPTHSQPMAPLSSCQILHLRHQVNLRDDFLQLYSDSDEEEEEEAEEDQQRAHPCDASKL